MSSLKITITVDDAKKLQGRFRELRERAIPHATREALNGLAFAAKEEWPKQMAKAFTLRNKWTAGSVRVRKAVGNNISRMQSEVYSASPYLAKQEHGGTESAKGKHGVAIPTSSAAGQSLKAKPRTRLVQKKSYLSALKLHRNFRGSRQARNAQAIREAKKTNGVAFLDLGRRKGLFRMTGKKGKPRMLYDLSHRRITLRPRKTLEPTIAHVRRIAPRILGAAMRQQLERRGHAKGTFIGPIRPVR